MSGIHEVVCTLCKGAITTQCRRGNCRLDLSNVAERLTIVDADKHLPVTQEGEKKPDFFVFLVRSRSIAVVVEMKDGKGKAEHADQVQAGADHLASLLSDISPLELVPLLLHQSFNPTERKALNRRNIRFRGASHPVWSHRCGADLAKVLELALLRSTR